MWRFLDSRRSSSRRIVGTEGVQSPLDSRQQQFQARGMDADVHDPLLGKITLSVSCLSMQCGVYAV